MGENPPTAPVFRGATKVTLDDKGRMVLPARHRERFIERSGGAVIVTADRSGECLLLYPLADWEPVERSLMALPTTDPESRRSNQRVSSQSSQRFPCPSSIA